jgi:hypothetical protein
MSAQCIAESYANCHLQISVPPSGINLPPFSVHPTRRISQGMRRRRDEAEGSPVSERERRKQLNKRFGFLSVVERTGILEDKNIRTGMKSNGVLTTTEGRQQNHILVVIFSIVIPYVA